MQDATSPSFPPESPSPRPSSPPEGSLPWLKEKLLSRLDGLRKLETPHLGAERAIMITLGLFLKKPELLDCYFESILLAVSDAIALGLEPGREIHLIPRQIREGGRVVETELTTMIDYKGLIAIAYRSPIVGKIEARAVFAGEPFAVFAGDAERIDHEVRMDVKRDGDHVVAAYSIATLSTGQKLRHVMNLDELERVRSKSRGKDQPTWTDPGNRVEMYRKTTLRNLIKYLPFPETIAQAINRADTTEFSFESERGSESAAPGSAPASVKLLPSVSGNQGAAALVAEIAARRSAPPVSQTVQKSPEAASVAQERPESSPPPPGRSRAQSVPATTERPQATPQRSPGPIERAAVAQSGRTGAPATRTVGGVQTAPQSSPPSSRGSESPSTSRTSQTRSSSSPAPSGPDRDKGTPWEITEEDLPF